MIAAGDQGITAAAEAQELVRIDVEGLIEPANRSPRLLGRHVEHAELAEDERFRRLSLG